MSDHILFHGPNHEVGLRFFPRVALVGGMALTALLHGNIEYSSETAHGPRVTLDEVHQYVRTEYTQSPPLGPGEPDTRTVTHERPGPPDIRTSRELVFVDSGYARGFEKDPAVRRIDLDAVQTLSDLVKDLQQDNWEDITLRIEGKVSAEDEHQDRLGGVTTDSEPNRRTGLARRDRFVEHLETTRAVSGAKIEKVDTVEPKFSDAQVRTLEGYVDRYGATFGYSDPDGIIESFNTGQPVPPDVAADLTEWLVEQRGLRVEVLGRKSFPGKTVTETTLERICVVQVQEVIERHETMRPWKATLPWIIPIFPAVLPLYRRRRSLIGTPYHPFGRYRPSQRFPHGAGGGAGGGGASTEDMPSAAPEESIPPSSEPQPRAAPPESPKVPRTKERRRWPRWPWLILPAAAALSAASWLIGDCIGDSGPSKPPSAEEPADPCEGLPKVEKVVGPTLTKVIVDGVVERVEEN